jgi:hypothetical protein
MSGAIGTGGAGAIFLFKGELIPCDGDVANCKVLGEESFF